MTDKAGHTRANPEQAACETDPRLRLLNQEFYCWRHSRNAIHKVMKINAHHISCWPAYVAKLRDSAIAGRKLLRAYDVADRLARLRKEVA